jgi:2-amino-4-hydroxy-6-hydroxymethyldihydropteridine diphosphokinase
MISAYISLGSNLGDKRALLNRAIRIFREKVDDDLHVSSFYETAPVGYLEQDAFMNCVIALQTPMDPYSLLDICQHIESELDRVRTIRWGPRTIDCDLILYGDQTIRTERLTVPHPRYKERAFVLVPFIEVCRDVMLKNELLSALEAVEHQNIRKLDHE